MTLRPKYFVTLLIALAITDPYAAAKRKDDVVVMKNGDRFTGEIKQLSHGELAFKATYMSSAVELNWEEVERVESKDAFIISLIDGTRVTGVIERPRERENNPTVIRVNHGTSASTFRRSDVVDIQQSERTFFNQLTGSVDIGFSFATGNQTADYFAAASAGYRTRKNEYSLRATSDLNQSDTNGTSRHALTLEQRHMLGATEKWFTIGIADFLHSEQQELSLRSTLAGGIGRRLFKTDHTDLSAVTGAAYTHESYSPNSVGIQERSNAEAFVGIRFTTFRFSTLAIGTSASIYPSVSDPGRARFVSDGDLKIELTRNLYWRFSVYENFDNKPPVSAPRNDFGTSSSLGWSF